MPRAPDLAGRVLDGRYELRELIGEGTFGRIYRGYDRRLKRIVAVKVIKPWWAEDPHWVERFEREAQLLARVSDPGIVQIFDVGHSNSNLYYVAELVVGESLADRLRRGPLDAAHATSVAEQLCRALASAHAQGVVHRDVKPANVLFGPGDRVKVGDFGVAQLVEGSTGGGGATAVGTPLYMAPEQARGERTSAASDVYGVGVVLYEMLAGRPPFTGEAAVDVAVRHLQDPPPPLPAEVPRALAEVVERALAKDPAERYPDGGAMAQALGAARDGSAPTTVQRAAAGSDAETTVQPAAAGSGAATTVQSPADAPTTAQRPASGAPITALPQRRPDATQLDPRRDAPAPARPKRRGHLAAALILGAGLALVAFALLAGSDRTRVPELRGLSREGVRARAGRLNVKPVFERRYSTSVAKGRAITQDPLPGQSVSAGSTVRVTLSDGPKPVAVPDLSAQELDSARSALEALGLRADVKEAPADGAVPGTVITQSPAPLATAVPGTAVELTIAQEPQWRTVTTFVGADDGSSVPFRIRGERWRVVYDMSFEGRCRLLLVCYGPAAEVTALPAGDSVESWDLDKGSEKTRDFRTDSGVYQLTISGGDDSARWTMRVQDFY